jgi:uncharacterized protein (DUF4415 family)
MKRYQIDPTKPHRLSMKEQRQLSAARIDYSDIPPLGEEFFSKARRTWPPAKQQVTLRIDTDVVAWLKANGRGYQTRINHILRAAMESRGPRRAASPAKAKSRGAAKLAEMPRGRPPKN